MSQLPVQLTSFIGREAELTELVSLARRYRLVTLIGPGGVGKTRLAIEAVSRLHAIEIEIESTYFVDLAPLREPGLLEPTLLAALGGRQDAGRTPLESIIGLLDSPRPVLLIDNCEHLIDPVARLVGRLLRTIEGLRVLATSREPLHVEGESRYLVSQLDDTAGVRLFVERARLVDSKFVLTKESRSTIARLCHELDGLPLAIELAAARVGQMPVGEILNRLDDRFALLTTSDRARLPRHRSLDAAIAWSYDLLHENERDAFACLSVFAGDFDPEAAETVTKCKFQELGRLVDKSMVVRNASREGHARYRLLETVRQYASERLNEGGKTHAVGANHFRYYAALAAKAAPELRAPQEMFWLDRLTDDVPNLRAALEWGLIEDPDAALTMGVDLIWFWHRRSHPAEGRSWLRRLAAAAPSPRPDTLAAALTQAADFAHWIGERDVAEVELGRALALWRQLGNPAGTSRALVVMALAAGHTEADLAGSRSLLEEAVQQGRRVGDDHEIAEALSLLGLAVSMGGNHVEGRAHQNEAEAIARRIGDVPTLAWIIWRDAAAYFSEGQLGRARSRYEEGLELRSTGALTSTDVAHAWLGRVRLAQNHEADARQHFEAALTLERALLREPVAIEGLAVLAGRHGRFERALKLLGAASSMPWWGTRVELPAIEIEQCMGAARGALGPEAADAAWQAGAAMTTTQAITYALSDADEPQAGDGPLTGREKEIATLVAGGLRNHEIAERLQISPRTVDAHVEHIRNKLGYRSRAQVAGWAIEQGLLKS